MSSLALPFKNVPFSGSRRPTSQSQQGVIGCRGRLETVVEWPRIEAMVGDGKSLRGKDNGGGDGAVFGDEDVEGTAQGTVVHDFEADSLLAEQSVYLWFREQLLLAGAEQYYCRLRFEYRRQVFGVQLL